MYSKKFLMVKKIAFIVIALTLGWSSVLASGRHKSNRIQPGGYKIEIYYMNPEVFTRQRLDDSAVMKIGDHYEIEKEVASSFVGLIDSLKLDKIDKSKSAFDARIAITIESKEKQRNIVIFYEPNLISIDDKCYAVDDLGVVILELKRLIKR